MNTLSLVAGAAKKTANALEQRGLSASLVKERWLTSHSTPSEFADYAQIAEELMLETIASSDAAEILFSDDDSYPFVSMSLRDRVRNRTRMFGSVSDLMSEPSRRHLVYVSIPEQRFAMMLERSSTSQIEMYSKFMASLDQERERELLSLRTDIDELHESPERSGNNCFSVQNFLRKAFLAKGVEKGYATYPPENQAEVAAILVDGQAKVHFHLVHRPDDLASQCKGSIYLKTYIRNESFGKRTVSQDVSLMFYFTALSGILMPYRNFSSSAELAVCCVAWAVAASVLAEEFRLSGLDVIFAVPSGS